MTSKKVLIKKCQEILKRHRDGESLSNEEFGFIFNLLHSHPHYDEKTKDGIYDIIVRKNVRGARGITIPYQFRMINKNGEEIPFSFYKCINNYNIKNEIKKAFRVAIQGDIINFKLANLNKKGVADHKIPFQKLLNDFLKQEGLELKEVEITFPVFGLPRLKNNDLEKKWIEYHRKNAILQIISKEENLKKIKIDKKIIRGEINE